jgi:hypothetical protein
VLFSCALCRVFSSRSCAFRRTRFPLDTAAMTERKIQRHDSDSDSSTDPNTLAVPEGHKLRKSTTALRFASSKLALVNTPVQEVHEGEEQRLIPDPHAKAPTPEPAGEQKTLRFTKVCTTMEGRSGGGMNGMLTVRSGSRRRRRSCSTICGSSPI